MKIEYPKSYIAWDLETSGLDPARDKILEIGAMRVIDGEIAERRRWVLNNGIEIPAEITAINGMTREIVEAEGRDPVWCLTEFVDFIRHGAIEHLTHNGIRFDIPFLQEQARQVLKEDLVNMSRWALDTAVFFKAGEMNMPREWNEMFIEWADRVMNTRVFGLKYNLGLCCEKLGVDREGIEQHRALGDVELTHRVYQKIIA